MDAPITGSAQGSSSQVGKFGNTTTNALHFFPVRRQPTLPRPHIPRQALSDSPALIILKAGGGSGKSVAAAQIAAKFVQEHASAGEPAEGTHSVWVRLAPSDNSEPAFWSRIFSVLDQAGQVPDGTVAKDLVRGGLSSASRDIIVTAFTELSSRLLLILDDSNDVLDSAIEESIIHALSNVPLLTIVLTTRRAPDLLVSTRARLQIPINILDVTALTFTESDVGDLVRLRIPDGPATQNAELTHRVYRRTKGWPLAVDAFIIESTASQTLAPNWRPGSFVREYIDHLLETRTEEMRRALYVSSLFEEVSVELLAHMLAQPETHVEELIANKFESSLEYWTDESGVRWYRHRDLLRAELYERAQKSIDTATLQEIYRSAAEWLRYKRPRYAQEAAIHAQAWAFLDELLSDDFDVPLRRHRTHVWLERVPAEVRERYPTIAMYALINEYSYPSGKYRQMITGLRLLASRTLARDSEQDGPQGITAGALRMGFARISGMNDLADTMANRVQQGLSDFSDADVAQLNHAFEYVRNHLAITLIHTARFSEADAVLETLLTHPEDLLERNLAHGTGLAAWSSAWQGNMSAVRSRLSAAHDLLIPVGWKNAYMGAGYRIAGALNALEQDDLEEAQRQLAAMDEHEPTIEHWPYLTCLATLLEESQRGPAEALIFLEQQLRRHQGRSALLSQTTRMLQVLRMRLVWQSGQILAKDKRGPQDVGSVFTALSRGEDTIAFGLALSTSRLPVYSGNHRARAELLLLQAESARRIGNTAAATEAAVLAASLMSEHGLILPMRTVSRESAEQLAQLAPELPVAHSSRGTSRQVQPLTPAELSALQAVIETGTVPAAAEALFLSTETVKGYMKQVYRKLSVRNRAEAIQVASEAQLLSPRNEDSLNELPR